MGQPVTNGARPCTTGHLDRRSDTGNWPPTAAAWLICCLQPFAHKEQNFGGLFEFKYLVDTGEAYVWCGAAVQHVHCADCAGQGRVWGQEIRLAEGEADAANCIPRIQKHL